MFLNPSTQLYLHYVAPKITVAKYIPNNYHTYDSVLKAIAHISFTIPAHGPIFLIGSGYLRNYKWQEGIDNFNEKVWPGLKLSVLFWPPAYFLAYRFIKGGLLLPVMNVQAFVFAVLLSYLNNNQINMST